MTNLFIVFIFLLVFLVIFLFSLYLKKHKGSANKTKINLIYESSLKKHELNPDISTDNWDLHKFRLEKFRRSQYKGLTFFLNSENRIYYLSEKGVKIYC